MPPKKSTPKKSAKKSATKKVAKPVSKKKAVAKKIAKKKAPAAKKAVSKAKAVAKPTDKKIAPTARKAPKRAKVSDTISADKEAESSTANKPEKAPKAAKAVKTVKKTSATTTKKSISSKTKSSAPAAKSKPAPSRNTFSLDDALNVAKKRKTEKTEVEAKKAASERARKLLEEAEQKAEKRILGAASLDDLLGIDPTVGDSNNGQSKEVPKKYQKFYDILIELRDHVSEGLHLHSEETLKRSSKDDSGDLSSYGQHMADAGTDTFDRDFALSMVSSDQEALAEVEAAIQRIYNGTYGICETTGKQIREERLMAVPFTRYSMKTQEQMERTTHRSVQRGGIFSDLSSEDTITFENADSE